MPRSSPICQCGLTSKSNFGFSPMVLTTTLPSSSSPMGTVSAGRLGIFIKIDSSFIAISRSCSSNCLIRPPTSRISCINSAGFSFNRPNSRETSFLFALRLSISTIVNLRCLSRSAASETGISIPRLAAASSRISGCSLIKSISINC